MNNLRDPHGALGVWPAAYAARGPRGKKKSAGKRRGAAAAIPKIVRWAARVAATPRRRRGCGSFARARRCGRERDSSARRRAARTDRRQASTLVALLVPAVALWISLVVAFSRTVTEKGA